MNEEYDYYEPAAQPAAPGGSGFSTASVILGGLSIAGNCCCYGGLIMGSLAIIFALLSDTEGRMDAQAKAGLITGSIGLALGVLMLVFILLFVFMEGGEPEFPSPMPDLDTVSNLLKGGRL